MTSFFKIKDKDNANEANSANLDCTDDDIKQKAEKIEELWTPKSLVKKIGSKRAIHNNQPNLYYSIVVSTTFRKSIQIAKQNRKPSRDTKQIFKPTDTLKQRKSSV